MWLTRRGRFCWSLTAARRSILCGMDALPPLGQTRPLHLPVLWNSECSDRDKICSGAFCTNAHDAMYPFVPSPVRYICQRRPSLSPTIYFLPTPLPRNAFHLPSPPCSNCPDRNVSLPFWRPQSDVQPPRMALQPSLRVYGCVQCNAHRYKIPMVVNKRCKRTQLFFRLIFFSVDCGVMTHNTTQHNTTQHNTTQHNTTQHNTTQHNTTQHNTTQHNTTQHNTTQHNTTQCNTTQHNTTQHNTTQHNTTQHNTTQHNTTQHNTTQHSTTQHKTT